MRRPALALAFAVLAIATSCPPGPDSPASAPIAQSAAGTPARPESIAPLAPLDGRTLYRIDAALDAATHAVSGHAEIHWTNLSSREVDELYLYLHLNAFSSEETTFLRESRGRLRDAEYGGPGGIELSRLEQDGLNVLGRLERSETWVRLPLDRPIPPGGGTLLTTEFTTHLPPVFARTGWRGSFHLVAQWFPKIPVLSRDGRWLLRERHANAEFFADHADYDVAVDVPKGWTVGASGREVPEGSRSTVDSRQSTDPSRGTAGKHRAADAGGAGRGFERHRFVLRQAVDFAWTAWNGFRTIEEDVGGMALRWLYPRGAERTLERQRLAVQSALPRLRAWLGEPAVPWLTLVLVPRGAEGAGGMEYPGLVTTTSSPSFPGYRDDQEVAIHETIHQWFYALVASDEAREPWLDEGLTTWVTGVVLDELFGDDRSMISAGPLGIGFFPSRRACWRLAAAAEPIDLAADAYPSFAVYASTVYCRSSLAFEALALVVGRDAVLRGLERYVSAHRLGQVTAADLFAALAAECGGEAVERVLAREIASAGGFDLTLEDVAVWRAERKSELIAPRTSPGERWVTRFTVRRHGTAVELPVDVEVRFPGTVRRSTWDGRGEGASFAVQSDRPPESILVDPERRVLLDRNLLDNGWRRSPPPLLDGLADEITAGYGGLLEVLF